MESHSLSSKRLILKIKGKVNKMLTLPTDHLRRIKPCGFTIELIRNSSTFTGELKYLSLRNYLSFSS